ncbi:MAG: AMP-binding protein, partial [Spirochaetota bacterium]
YMSNRHQVLTWLDLQPEDIALSAFPLFHIAGLALGGFTMTQGITQICVPNPRDAHFLINALKTYKPTFVVNVPTVYFELLKQPAFKELNLKTHLKWCLSAAAPFPAEYIKSLEEIIGEGNFIELYGMTEMSPVMICNPRYGTKKASSIGMPISDTEVTLIDPETGQLAKIGETGEIVIKGPQLMKGYFNKPDETAKAVKDGCIRAMLQRWMKTVISILSTGSRIWSLYLALRYSPVNLTRYLPSILMLRLQLPLAYPILSAPVQNVWVVQ